MLERSPLVKEKVEKLVNPKDRKTKMSLNIRGKGVN